MIFKFIKFSTIIFFILSFSLINISNANNINKPNVKKTQNTNNIQNTNFDVNKLLKNILPSVVSIKALKNDRYFKSLHDNEMKYYKYIENNMVFSIGSGFLISADGIILTNNHIIEGADKIIVEYNNEEVDVDIIGYDNIYDLALLKMKNKTNLPFVELKKNVKYELGENIFVIGNPYNLGLSVSSGIISAINRNLKNEFYENLIQTDAVINKGNSGGPMFNSRGEVLGITSIIFSPNGNNIGLGFAIPINSVIDIIDKLNRFSYIQRGWIGINSCEDLKEKDFKVMKIYNQQAGCMVLDTTKDSPSEKAGIKIGDIITMLNDTKINNFSELTVLVRNTSINSKVDLTVVRNGLPINITVTLEEYLDDIKEKENNQKIKNNTITEFNVNFIEIDKTIINKFGLNYNERGMLVLNVLKDSYAYMLGIREGNILLMINQQEIKTKDDFIKNINQVKSASSNIFYTIFKQDKKNHIIKFNE